MEFKSTGELVLTDGTVLPALIKCKKYTANISPNWMFCPHCGKQIIEKK